MNSFALRLGTLSALSLVLLTANSAHAQEFMPGNIGDLGNSGNIGNVIGNGGGFGGGDIPGLDNIGNVIGNGGGDIPELDNIGSVIGNGGGLGDLFGSGGVGNVLNDPMGFVLGKLQGWLQSATTAWGELSTDNPLASLSKGEGGLLDTFGIAEESKGALGMPDPERAAKAAAEKIDGKSGKDPSEVALAHQRTIVRNTIERELARANSQSVLGQEGQQQIKQSGEQAGQSVQGVAQVAQKAQGLSVTQDVMKQMALQNAQLGTLLGAMYTEELSAKVDRAHTNLNLANISQTLDQQQRARRAQLSGQAALLMQIANQSSLR